MRSHAQRKAGANTAARANSAAVDYFRTKLEYDIGPYSLKEILDASLEEVCIVDCRNAEFYAEGHIPTAMSIPLAALSGQFAALPKEKTIVTYCGDITCPASSKAALELAQKGFKVKHLVGGIAEWTKKGYSIESAQRIEGEPGGPIE